MYKIKVISNFSSAHSLRNYKGKCEALHGHNWKVEVIVASNSLDSTGMVMDFNELKSKLATVLEELDHCHLNELEYFKNVNPSSEEIARYIYDKLKQDISSKKCLLEEVRIWEAENSCAIYQENNK